VLSYSAAHVAYFLLRSTSPVKILIDGVYLQLEPLDLSSLNPEQIREKMQAAKFYQLNEADKAYHPSGEGEENTSYFQRLTAKIIGIINNNALICMHILSLIFFMMLR
jgi:hypothetical protein